MARRLTYEEILEKLSNINKNKKIIVKDLQYDTESDIHLECTVCHHNWTVKWKKIADSTNKNTCPSCRGMVVSDLNRISIVRPDLIKYFKNKDDASIFSIGSHKITTMVCPNCGEEKDMMITDLTRKPFCCRICSDGISKGEKFVLSFLQQLNMRCEPQKSFKWLKYRTYDFYLEDINMIIEVHGEQHYRTSGFKRKSLKEEQANDKLKKGTALKNGIANYIELRYYSNDFEKLKDEICLKLSDILNIDNIDWGKCYEYCNSSNITIAYKLYCEKLNINNISKIMNLNRKTIRKYLRIAKSIFDKEI